MATMRFEFSRPSTPRVIDIEYSSLGDGLWAGTVYVDQVENPYVDEGGQQYTPEHSVSDT